MTIREMREKRGAISDQAAALLNEARLSSRNLSSVEQAQFDRLMAEQSSLRAQIEREEQHEGLDAELRTPMGRKTELALADAVDADGNSDQRILGPGDSVAKELRATRDGDEFRGLRPGALLRAMVTGPRTDVEKRALSAGTDSAGGYGVPDIVSAQFIDKMRAQSACIRAGARTIMLQDGRFDIARLATDPTTSWIAENGTITDSSPTFEAAQFRPKIAVALVKVSRVLVEDSVNIESMLEAAFAGAMAAAVDLAALEGASGGDNPVGIANITNVNSVSMGTNGAAPTDYDKIVDAWYENAVDSAPDPTAIIVHPRTTATFAKLATGITSDNTPLVKPALIANIPWYQQSALSIARTQGSSSVASNLYIGYFPHLLLGIRAQLRVEVLKETFAGNYQFGFLAHLRMDTAVEHPESFCKLIGLIP